MKIGNRGFARSFAMCAAMGAAAVLSAQPAWADHGDEHYHGHIERFHEHDWALWHGGQWHHEFHDGRLGWWWVAGGIWYYYPAPVYPYPNPYEPPVAVVVPSTPSTPPPPPQPQNWYYCESARGYYPYIPSCPSGWQAVPATPGTPPAPPVSPPR